MAPFREGVGPLVLSAVGAQEGLGRWGPAEGQEPHLETVRKPRADRMPSGRELTARAPRCRLQPRGPAPELLAVHGLWPAPVSLFTGLALGTHCRSSLLEVIWSSPFRELLP